MALKDILVHIDNSVSCENRLQTALQLAEQHGAHLIGLYTIPPLTMPGYVAVEIPLETIQTLHNAAKRDSQQGEALFSKLTTNSSVSCEWRCEEGTYEETLLQHARYVDLIVIGQQNRQDSDAQAQIHSPDNILLDVGRPVLIIPHSGQCASIGKQVLIGWNGSREAIRAINHAIPILQVANKVEIVSIEKSKQRQPEKIITGTDIALHLARHDVTAEAHIISSEGNTRTATLLLTHAGEIGADLLVIGAYGHSRWKEMILGGVTHELLDTMTLPVFASH